jgi:hypothetical protein
MRSLTSLILPPCGHLMNPRGKELREARFNPNPTCRRAARVDLTLIRRVVGQASHLSDRIKESREAWEVEVDVSEYDPERVRLRSVFFLF